MGGVEKRRELGLKEFFLTGAGGGRRGRRGRRAARKWWPWAPLEAEVGDRGESDEEGEGDEVGNPCSRAVSSESRPPDGLQVRGLFVKMEKKKIIFIFLNCESSLRLHPQLKNHIFWLLGLAIPDI